MLFIHAYLFSTTTKNSLNNIPRFLLHDNIIKYIVQNKYFAIIDWLKVDFWRLLLNKKQRILK